MYHQRTSLKKIIIYPFGNAEYVFKESDKNQDDEKKTLDKRY